jgi:5-methylcytosine-specific restriction endonuclease McrA
MKTLILNLDFSPLSVVSAHRGLILSLKNDNVRTLEVYDWTITSENDIFNVPAVMMYQRFVKPTIKKRVSKKFVLLRDNMVCQYCSKKLDNSSASVDHIIPVSSFDKKEDANSWNNLVAACKTCNTKKGNKLIQDIGMTLIRKPKTPRGFINIYTVHEKWKKYVDCSVQN